MQLEFPGALALADGRYLARAGTEDGAQSVLVIETLAAPSPRGRRRRASAAEPDAELPTLPLTRVTAVRAHEPFDSEEAAIRWLDSVTESEEALELVLAEGAGLLNRALHAHATASANPGLGEIDAARAIAARVGYGSGEQVAASRFTQARDVDAGASRGSRRQRRAEELRPQERVAAVLAGRELIDACETLLLRARADLDAGRMREAALQLRVGLEALLFELDGALLDPAHEADMTALGERRQEAVAAAAAALQGDLDAERAAAVRELTAICERVLRRRRVLRG